MPSSKTRTVSSPASVSLIQTPTASRSIAGAYVPVRAAAFIFARW